VDTELTVEDKTFGSRFAPVYQNSDVVGAIATLWDVTELRRAEARVKELNAELEERVETRTRELENANRELDAFTHAASHDLRAPLRGIDFVSEALLEDYGEDLDAEGRASLKRLRRESDRATRLVLDLLNLSRVKRAEFHREDVDVTALARDVIRGLERSEPDRDVDARVEDDLTAFADVNLLRIALENVIGNAWKFTRKTPDARIRVGVTRVDHDAHECAFFVKDNGAGFDPTQAERLFEPFQRLHAPTEYEGTGVGLTTVKRIVERHGGDVWAKGKPGEGATFYFTIAPPEDAEPE
jgi:signal transduction histidine kinase